LGGGLETALACGYRQASCCRHSWPLFGGWSRDCLGVQLPRRNESSEDESGTSGGPARHPPRRWRMSAPPPSHWSPGGAGNYSGGEDGSRQACAPNGDR
jgi:hypothetical protein